jgi:hypothetical protein
MSRNCNAPSGRLGGVFEYERKSAASTGCVTPLLRWPHCGAPTRWGSFFGDPFDTRHETGHMGRMGVSGPIFWSIVSWSVVIVVVLL